MCSGRVDPVMIAEAFVSGADGVFIGACLPGECHYTSGNFQAMGKIQIIQKLLHHSGVNPDRLTFKMMSSAEGAKFVSFVAEFQSQIREFGKIGSSEKMPTNDLEIKLSAIRAAVNGKKLRWVAGKRLEFLETGNLYGEIFTEHEIHRMFEEVVMDELTIQEILLRAKKKPVTIKKLSDVLHQPTKRVLRQLVDMRKMGLVKITGVEKDSPLWMAC